MTTREEYAKAAGMCEAEALTSTTHKEQWFMISNVMRLLANGAALCHKEYYGVEDGVPDYFELDYWRTLTEGADGKDAEERP